ncbi:DUF5362 family protein [Flavobacterium sp.]|uniref:DUF5362 family protein n=1 Tax=Flavobacterium sp. TaxID=239 RepID=UPI002FDCACEE
MEQNLELNQLAKDALREGAKWTFFLAIMGFIGIGFMVLAGIFMTITLSAIPDQMGDLGFFGAMKNFMSLFYLLMAVLYFFPIYYLYKYSSKIKTALQFNDTNLLADAFVNLKAHHKFLGISVIVILSLYLLIIVGTVIALFNSAAF